MNDVKKEIWMLHLVCYMYVYTNPKGKFLVQVIYILLMIKYKNLQDSYENGPQK